MAQQKRKRKTKHRGTPAGNVVARGRTSRPTTRGQARWQAAQTRAARQRARAERANMPPTWRGSAIRAAVGGAIIVVISLVWKQPVQAAIFLGMTMFLLYIPANYYLELFLFNRRQAKQARMAQAKQRAREQGAEE